jgi:hypothetical protein
MHTHQIIPHVLLALGILHAVAQATAVETAPAFHMLNTPLFLAHVLQIHHQATLTKYSDSAVNCPGCTETPPVTDPFIADALELLSAMSGDERYAALCRTGAIDAQAQTE